MKRYYKIGEKIWVKQLKTTGIVKELQLDAKSVVVQTKEAIIKLNLWDIDKYTPSQSILVKYHDPEMPRLEKIVSGDWIDLRCTEEVVLKQFDFYLIPLGVSMKLPDGYEANIVPRSSTYKNFGVLQTNSFGVVDNSYCGNNDLWYMPVIALRDTVIPKYSRICQFRINKVMPKVNFNEVEELVDMDRKGLGSTGIS